MNKRFIFSIAWIVLGITFLVCSILGILDDFWSGLGCGLFAVGTMQLIRVKRYASNPDYRTAVDTEVNDERNKYISMRAWAWAGYSYIMICAAAVILLKPEWTAMSESQAEVFALCLLCTGFSILYYKGNIKRKKQQNKT